MISNLRSGTFIFVFVLAALVWPCRAQQGAPPQPGASQESTPPGQAVAPGHAVQVQKQKPPPQEPAVIEDGGWSLEPIYWLNRAQPRLRGGASALSFGNLDYPGKADPAMGAQFSIPAGKQNTLRFSYFRVQGDGNLTEDQDVTLFSQTYSPGDYLSAGYKIQNAKISWDYLSYTWYRPSTKIRLKTLWELQYTTLSTTIVAPLKPITTDPNGNINNNTVRTSKSLFYPTFGLELEQPIGKHFRWEVKGSGFALPHHSTLWDAEASLAIRMGQFELLGGEKAFHFKTSPQADRYFVDTLSGGYVGLRWYWGGQRR